MAAPTNLLELAQQRLVTWTAEKTSAQAAVAAAQSAVTAGLDELKAATKDYTDATEAITDLRGQLSAIATPADGEPLLDELEDEIIAQRTASAAMLVQQQAGEAARTALGSARKRLQDAESAIAAAQGEVTAEEMERAKREVAKAAVALPPLSDLPARATDLQASLVFTDAEARIAADFPAALRERSIARAGFAVDDADRAATMHRDVEALIAAHESTAGGAGDKLAAPTRALRDAEDALYDYVTRAVSRCNAAEAALVRIGGTVNPPLSAEVHDAINDAVALPEREAAATAEGERDIAADAVDVAQATYDLEYLEVFAADGAEGVTTALADATSDLAEANEGLDDAKDALADAEAAYDGAMRETMQVWRAAVPDSAWRDLADFDAASRAIDEFKQNPSALVTAVTNAEAALLTASLAVEDEAQRQRAYAQALEASGGAAEAAASLLERARFSALRGDA